MKKRILVFVMGNHYPEKLKTLAGEVAGMYFRNVQFHDGALEKCDEVGGLIPSEYEGYPVTKHQNAILEILGIKTVSTQTGDNPQGTGNKSPEGTVEAQIDGESDNGGENTDGINPDDDNAAGTGGDVDGGSDELPEDEASDEEDEVVPANTKRRKKAKK